MAVYARRVVVVEVFVGRSNGRGSGFAWLWDLLDLIIAKSMDELGRELSHEQLMHR